MPFLKLLLAVLSEFWTFKFIFNTEYFNEKKSGSWILDHTKKGLESITLVKLGNTIRFTNGFPNKSLNKISLLVFRNMFSFVFIMN